MMRTILLTAILCFCLPSLTRSQESQTGSNTKYTCADTISIGKQQIYVAQWRDDCDAAISYTFDDGLQEHYTLLRAKLREHRFPATFAIVGNRIGGDFKGNPTMTWEQLREMVADGHEISNHGWSHLNLTTITPEQRLFEIEHNDSVIHDSLGLWPRTFIYPGNRRSPEVIKACEKGRVGSRTFQQSLGSKRNDENLRKMVEDLIASRGWAVTMTHGITRGYDHFTDSAILWRHFNHVDSLRHRIWVGTLSDVFTYSKLRKALRLEAVRQPDGTIVVKPFLDTTIVPDITDSSLYNGCLTMVVTGENRIQATQDGRPLETIVRENGQQLLFNPHGGQITIKAAF